MLQKISCPSGHTTPLLLSYVHYARPVTFLPFQSPNVAVHARTDASAANIAVLSNSLPFTLSSCAAKFSCTVLPSLLVLPRGTNVLVFLGM